MILLGCGDSWCWGAELVDPTEEPVPIMTLPDGGFERQFKPINLEYRFKYRYINQFANKMGADDLVDLSEPSLSNDAIYRKLVEYLSAEDYLHGKDTNNLFISIGWTSPERREFWYKKGWGGHYWYPFGPWSMDQKFDDKNMKDFMQFYYENFWNAGEFIHRYINTVYQTETLLKKFNIKYVMHQAFYHAFPKMPKYWDDKEYREEFEKYITVGDKKLWDCIDEKRFIHKNDEEKHTVHHYILSQANNNFEKVFEVYHPNANGHTIWADYLYQYCLSNSLL